MTGAFLACMMVVGSYNRLPPKLLPAIQAVEGGRVGLVVPDPNGTSDLGVMQINSRWVPALARFTGWTQAAVFRDLVGDACFNIAAAGAILRLYVREDDGNLLKAIGDYHSHTPLLHNRYLHQVLTAATRVRTPPVTVRLRMSPP
ncbi:MAG: lytic transglycosylase domain-containing protein [Rhodospirillales bacterium]|nr:lytic transglycosylase domain-containing protein [Rhodospirillales bacterium]